MIIRPEEKSDIPKIERMYIESNIKDRKLLQSLWPDSNPPEINDHLIVNKLRETGALTLSLVADIDGQIVGHAAFSPVKLDGREKGWFAFQPINVASSFRRRGIGGELVGRGLELMTIRGAKGCISIFGDYLENFGFLCANELKSERWQEELHYISLPQFKDPRSIPVGMLEFHEAFSLWHDLIN